MKMRARRRATEVTYWERGRSLMVSLVLLFGGFSLGFFSAWALQEQDQRAQAERVLEDRRVQEATLEAYRTQMNTYLLEEGLGDSEEGDRVRKAARLQTLTVLERLGPQGKGSVVRFLYEASLIDEDRTLIDLSEADLSEADLSGADLTWAYLWRAEVTEEQLNESRYLQGAIMPDGSRHR